MRSSSERVALGSCNLGTIKNLQTLTAALDAITGDLERTPQGWSRSDLLEFRRTLDGLCAVMIKLRGVVRDRLGALMGVERDAV